MLIKKIEKFEAWLAQFEKHVNFLYPPPPPRKGPDNPASTPLITHYGNQCLTSSFYFLVWKDFNVVDLSVGHFVFCM